LETIRSWRSPNGRGLRIISSSLETLGNKALCSFGLEGRDADLQAITTEIATKVRERDPQSKTEVGEAILGPLAGMQPADFLCTVVTGRNDDVLPTIIGTLHKKKVRWGSLKLEILGFGGPETMCRELTLTLRLPDGLRAKSLQNAISRAGKKLTMFEVEVKAIVR
ncbi:MAG: hypothetical protein KDD44_15130, partial [Bdellovibrionales bacterium]|nr:hypothetical protein [Bdellovibrionales bacterium]